MIAAAAASPEIPLTWLFLRTTGIVAIALLTVSTVVGIVSPALRSPSRRLVAISIHNSAAATGVVLLLGHVVLAVLDSFIAISPLAVLVPGVSEWKPLWVGVGTVSLDLMILIVLTTLNRFRAPVSWRRVHLMSYAAIALAWAHAMFTGTDAGSRPMQLAALASLAAVGFAVAFRQSRRQHRAVVPAPEESQPPLVRVTAGQEES